MSRSSQNHNRVSSLTEELRTMTAAFQESPQKFRFFARDIFSDAHTLGSESIDRVRAMNAAVKKVAFDLEEMDKRLFGNLGGVVSTAAAPRDSARRWSKRDPDAAALTDKDQAELEDFVRNKARERLHSRIQEVLRGAMKYGL